LAGDKRKAEETYRKLVKNEATRFVGVRGIIKQKLANGDKETALRLAEKAFALKPKHEDTQDLLLKLQAEKEDWAGARQTLGAKLKYGNLPRDVHKRRDAVLALSEAKQIFAKNQKIEAREEAILANRLSPDLIPAAVMAAHSYLEKKQKKHATRLLKKAWAVQPHPDLAAAFAMIEPNETPGERLKRFSFLTKNHKNNSETKMLMAELYIAAEQFPQARRVLGNLVDTDPTTRSITLMAAIERGEGSNDAIVQGWLTKMLTAPRGPQWLCEKCQNIHSEWTPTCKNCGAFDTLEWKRPSASDVIMPKGSEMLPLLVNRELENNNAANALGNTDDTSSKAAESHQKII
jgi:HemY protein